MLGVIRPQPNTQAHNIKKENYNRLQQTKVYQAAKGIRMAEGQDFKGYWTDRLDGDGELFPSPGNSLRSWF